MVSQTKSLGHQGPIDPLEYKYIKKKKHCIINIRKHDNKIKINFDLWKP